MSADLIEVRWMSANVSRDGWIIVRAGPKSMLWPPVFEGKMTRMDALGLIRDLTFALETAMTHESTALPAPEPRGSGKPGRRRAINENLVVLTDAQINIIRHALTGGPPGQEPSRNHFAADTRDIPSLDALVNMGLMRAGRTTSYGRLYHVTEAGAAAIGLSIPPDLR